MFSKVHSAGIHGIEGYPVDVETDVSDGLPSFTMVGYLASEVKEAQERVRTAMKNSGFHLGPKKITVNLSPADVRKEGTAFDLPVAIGVMASCGIIRTDVLKHSLFIGELGLDGEIKGVRGVLSIVLAARNAGIHYCFLPETNKKEGIAVSGISVIAVSTLREVAELFMQPLNLETVAMKRESLSEEEEFNYDVDFSEVGGQAMTKRATEIAVAGYHNILYIGQAGSGKSMIASRIPTIMPSMSKQEQLKISQIYSICGLLPKEGALLTRRPFRNPHHTATSHALAGGGRSPKPGEISLASGGVLFLDEFPEFQKKTLEILRQPLEDRKITISRLHGTYEFPADFMLAAAMNPCSCGFYPDRSRCRCTEEQIKRYLNRISGPLLDRIDICVETSPVTYEEIRMAKKGEPSSEMRKRVEKARMIQKQRFENRGIYFNSQMSVSQIREFCCLGKKEGEFLEKIFHTMGFSGRAYHKTLKVARTIADLEGREEICQEHLYEAIGYRGSERVYWGSQEEKNRCGEDIGDGTRV